MPRRPVIPISDAWFHRVKSATRDLVKFCGGVVRAGEIAGVSKAEVSRWQDAGQQVVVPIPAALALEADCGVAVVTATMAALNGRRLVDDGDRSGSGDPSAVISGSAGVMASMGDVIAVTAEAFADGRVTATEAERIDRSVGVHLRRVENWRGDLAAAKGPRPVREF